MLLLFRLVCSLMFFKYAHFSVQFLYALYKHTCSAVLGSQLVNCALHVW